MRVLIVKLSSIGDVVHTLPALASLRKGLGPGATIDWLVEEAASGALLGHPMIDEVIVVRRGWGANLLANLARARQLRGRRYDVVLDFQGLLKSALWVLLTRGSRRVGFSSARELAYLAYSERLPACDPERHAVDRYLDLAGLCGGAPPDEPLFTIELGKAEASVMEKLRAKGVDKPFFVMVARARWATKLWSDASFVELARRMRHEHGLSAVLVGSADDSASAQAMAGAIGPGAASLAGQTSLRELAALTRLSRMVVTVDSGPMHLAVAAGAKVVALFGPTAPWRTGPYGKGHEVVRKVLDCSPCFQRRCPEPRCMTGITVDDVMEAAGRLL